MIATGAQDRLSDCEFRVVVENFRTCCSSQSTRMTYNFVNWCDLGLFVSNSTSDVLALSSIARAFLALLHGPKIHDDPMSRALSDDNNIPSLMPSTTTIR